MGKGMPSPPDPYQTAAAQTNAGLTTAMANTAMQNANEFTPYGSKTYAQSGSQQIWDANTGKYITAPTYSSTVKLSPQEQAILRSEEHTSELQSQLTISYAVFCL